MIEALNNLMLQADAKKMVITLMPSEGGDNTLITIATEFNKLDESNPLQKKLTLPIVAKGYVGSLQADLVDSIRSFEVDSLQSNIATTESELENNNSQSEEIDSL